MFFRVRKTQNERSSETAFVYALDIRQTFNQHGGQYLFYYTITMWFVYDITGSSTLTGLLSGLIFIPKCMQVFYGPVINHFNVKKMLVGSQVVQAGLIGLIAVSLLLGYESAGLIILLVALAAFIGEISYPISNKLVPVLLSREKIVTGNSIMAFCNQSLDLVLNLLITVMISLVSIYSLYMMNTIIFIIAGLIYSTIKLTAVNKISVQFNFKEYKRSFV